MHFKQFYVGCLAHASYLMVDERTRTALAVDPYGGLIYAGHAVGASNMMSLYEVYTCMIDRRVEWGLVHGTGGADAVYGGVWALHNEG